MGWEYCSIYNGITIRHTESTIVTLLFVAALLFLSSQLEF